MIIFIKQFYKLFIFIILSLALINSCGLYKKTNVKNNPINDADCNQLVTLGLKSNAIATAKSQAAGYLVQYDWYVTRKAEKSTAIPSAITTYRDAVRAACDTIEGKITGAANFAEFIALYDTPESGNAPINDWPDALLVKNKTIAGISVSQYLYHLY